MSSRQSGFAPRVVTSFAGERFELIACIGRGATGGVYRARTADSPYGFAREVCIKRLSGQLSPEAERAMREEARLLASVRHANVVSLLAMGHEASGAPFLVLELIDGADLRVLYKAVALRSDPDHPGPAGVLPDQVAVYIGCALVRALAAVQRAVPGLVHRDVTPHNVLVSREGEVKLTDFGIALALDRARWTRPSVVKGKFGYMAPEQIRGEPLDVRTDLFAVGVVLFELLARKRPWFRPRGVARRDPRDRAGGDRVDPRVPPAARPCPRARDRPSPRARHARSLPELRRGPPRARRRSEPASSARFASRRSSMRSCRARRPPGAAGPCPPGSPSPRRSSTHRRTPLEIRIARWRAHAILSHISHHRFTRTSP